MDTLRVAFRDYIKQVMALSKAERHITDENVHQEGEDEILVYLDLMVKDLVLPGSGIDGLENLEELFAKAESGKSCLLLPEHYSNFDLSLFSYLVRHAGGRGEAIGRSVIAIAGMKLNEDDPIVSAFASAYSRIVIYPSRSFQGLDAEKDKAEIVRGNAINRAAMKALMEVKSRGRLILLFPSGTRYRPGDPSTKRGVREIDSYIKSFDYMCLVAINGEVLHIRHNDMMEDEVSQDLVRISVGPAISCEEFRDNVRSETGDNDIGGEDKKQAVADAIMAELERMHIENEEKRNLFLKKINL
ncbi:MAG: 1-acyl-sn-glycerol-3-phosphate acyltransferase [Treponema sp.]|jgi:glycerol-3-phosphate O-acyltransferase|nr:1-acyl-sn-glycerol-3-phosphate acyltransferase [Treponema sp.]